MSDRLDQSLDQILASRRTTGTRGRGRGARRVGPTRATTTAPTGGVQKKTRAAVKPAAKATTNGVAAAGNTGVDTKIIVSNLPRDVDEKQIQDYFSQSVGPVKKVFLQYGPTGASQGRATIIFSKPGGANKALEVNNGVLVEGKPMRIEIVVDASRATTHDTKTKTLSERISAPKSAAAQPKSAGPKKDKVTEKPAAGSAVRGVKTARGRGAKRGRNAGRPKRKTADQLDAEMTDYFTGGTEAPNGTAAPAAAEADTGMDEIS